MSAPSLVGDSVVNSPRLLGHAQQRGDSTMQQKDAAERPPDEADASHGCGSAGGQKKIADRRRSSTPGAAKRESDEKRSEDFTKKIDVARTREQTQRFVSGASPGKADSCMCSCEWTGICAGIVGLYLAVLYAIHANVLGVQTFVTSALFSEHHAQAPAAVAGEHPQQLPWDHPEPNFIFSPVITEFYSTVSAIPIAGGMQLYLAVKFGYAAKLRSVFALAFWMYNSAFVAHMSLHTHIFELTLSSVMFTAFSTFFLYGYVLATLVPCSAETEAGARDSTCSVFSGLGSVFSACRLVRALVCKTWRRLAIASLGMSIVVFCAINLPGYIGRDGGVWTLFYVQTPPVLLAFAASSFLALHDGLEQRVRTAASFLAVAGLLLSTAMAVSYVECSTGQLQVELMENAIQFALPCQDWAAKLINLLGPVPILHIAVHTLEQVGIYLFLTGLACLHGNVDDVGAVAGTVSEIRWTTGLIRLPYCHVSRSVR